MKLHPAVALLSLVLAIPAVLSAATFEGRVKMKMTDGRGNAHDLDYRIKENFVRMDLQLGEDVNPAMIMDGVKQQMIILMPEQKMYMVRPLQDLRETADRVSKDNDASFEKTSETAKILGYDCVKYISKARDVTSDVWVTDQLGRFPGFNSGSPMGGGRRGQSASSWEKALMGKDFFPLRVVSHNKKGKEEFRLDAVAVQKESVPASVFAPPADFQKFDLGGLMQGVGLPFGGKKQ